MLSKKTFIVIVNDSEIGIYTKLDHALEWTSKRALDHPEEDQKIVLRRTDYVNPNFPLVDSDLLVFHSPKAFYKNTLENPRPRKVGDKWE